MRALVLDEHGSEDVLRIREVPDPIPGPDEVLVRVVSSALNRADLLQRMGLYPGPPMAFEIPGLEFGGVVVGRGDRVVEVGLGDDVMGILGGGGHAELVATHERLCVPVPASIPLADAGAVPEVFFTAFDALVVQGGLTAGSWALVHAGASGVGTAAIQVARAIGADVIVTASSGKLAACRDLGATAAVDYATDDFVDAVAEHTSGRGVDVVLDVIGGDYVGRNIACLRTGGRILQVGIMSGGRAEVPVGELLMKRAQLIGTTLRSRPIEEKIALTQRVRRELLGGFDRGELRTVIDSRFALDDVAAAHRRMAANANVGKIVLDIGRR